MVRWINRVLRRSGWMLAPVPPSAKMLFEHANTCESQHLREDVHGHGDRCLYWLRSVGEVTPDAP